MLNRVSYLDVDCQRLHTSENEVRRAFQHVNPSKADSHDNIAPQVLKTCAEKLVRFFCFIFKVYFSTNTDPAAWKTARIVPVPKRPVISSVNDLRLVALAHIVMKVCERVALCK